MQTYETIIMLLLVAGGVGGLLLYKVKMKDNAFPAQLFFAGIVSLVFGFVIVGILRSVIKNELNRNNKEAVTVAKTTGKSIGSEPSNEQLLQEAAKASAFSYSPYSKIKVGAAVLTKNNKVYTAANVENASYGLTICAERAALFKSISEGDTAIKTIAIYSDLKNITPCGACRQVIAEFGKDIHVVFKYNDGVKELTIEQLAPYTFHIK